MLRPPLNGSAGPRNVRRAFAFTLVELLTVMAIIVIMIVAIAPAAVQLLRGNHLMQSGEMISDQIGLARQTALTSSRPVQVRFYQLPVAGRGSALNYCAVQSFRLEENGQARALTPLAVLRSGVVFAVEQKYSTLLTPPTGMAATVSGKEKLAAYGNQECKYVGFQFLPDGSTDLDPTPPTAATDPGGWFITMLDANRTTLVDGSPVDYYTLRVEPLDGRVQTFRP